MRKILTLLLLTGLLSCSDEENTCNVSDPIEDLPWLKETVQNIEATAFGRQYMYIQKAYYLGRPVFIVGNCCAFCNTIVPIYNCKGDLVCNLGECNDNLIRHKTVIWTSSQNDCSF